MIHQGRPEIGYLGATALDLDHPRNVKPHERTPYRSRSSRGCPSCGNAKGRRLELHRAFGTHPVGAAVPAGQVAAGC